MRLTLRLSQLVIPAAIALGWSTSPALAQQAGGVLFDLPHVRNYFALGLGGIPDYIGSDDYIAGIAPSAMIKFGNTERYAKLLVTDLQVNLLNSKNWSFGPAINYRFARDDVDDEVVKTMRDIDGTVEAGVFAGWTWSSDDDPRNRFLTSAEFLHDVGDKHEGYLVTVSARYFKPVSRPLTLSAGITTTYGSGDYMQTYFGVDADNASRSGLREFSAGSGFRDVRFPMIAIWSLSPKWHLAGGVVYSRLLSDAYDSPVVKDRGNANQIYAGVGVAYAW